MSDDLAPMLALSGMIAPVAARVPWREGDAPADRAIVVDLSAFVEGLSFFPEGSGYFTVVSDEVLGANGTNPVIADPARSEGEAGPVRWAPLTEVVEAYASAQVERALAPKERP